MKTIGVEVRVSVGREAATVDGTSIPVNNSAVPPSPMKIPMERYLMSARKVDRILIIVGPVGLNVPKSFRIKPILRNQLPYLTNLLLVRKVRVAVVDFGWHRSIPVARA